MKLTMQDKLNICREHVDEGKSLSHIRESYDNFPVSGIKYIIKLYKKHGDEPFKDRDRKIYRRDTKLLSIAFNKSLACITFIPTKELLISTDLKPLVNELPDIMFVASRIMPSALT